MKDLEKIREFFSKPLEEAKEETAIDMAKRQLDALGVKYEMSKTDKVRPFKVIYQPINKSDEFYDKFENIVDLFNLKGVVKSSMNEAKQEDPTDIIAMDVPLFLRMLEWAREDAQTDMELHDATERAIEAVKLRGLLSMEDYIDIIGTPKDEIDEITKGFGDRISAEAFSKLKGQMVNYYGNRYKVLDSDEYTITIEDEDGETRTINLNQFIQKGLIPELKKKIQETTRLGEGVIYEELCPKGKAYIKKRQASGEKSSAYLSGRAVKVCKGQMKG